VMSALERTAVGGFRIEEAVKLEELSADSLPQHLQPALVAVAELPRIELTDAQWSELRHGRPIAVPVAEPPAGGADSSSEWAAVDDADRLVAILRQKRTGQLWPAKVFF
jgi:tRNA pseudouridine55 synthase